MGRTSSRKARLDHYLCDSSFIQEAQLKTVHTYARRRKMLSGLLLLITVSIANAVFMLGFVAIEPPPPGVTTMMLVWGWVCSIPITYTFIALGRRRSRRHKEAHWITRS